MNIKNGNENKNLLKKNLILATFVVVIAIIPLLVLKNADFRGSDQKAQEQISVINANYKPWFSSIWKPPSAEIESLIFSLQAAIGSGIVCYYFGYLKGKSQRSKGENS